MAGEIRNKFVSWTLNVVKEIKEIPPKNNIYGVGVSLAVVPPTASTATSTTVSTAATTAASSPSPTSSNATSTSRASRVGVQSVHPHGSAAKAGLKSGDIIVQVDETKFYNYNFNSNSNSNSNDEDGKDRKEKGHLPNDVASAIRGPEGSDVNVIVERDGERIEFMLTRKPIGQRRVVQRVAAKAKVTTANDESNDENENENESDNSSSSRTGQAKKESGSKKPCSEEQGKKKKKKQESSDMEKQGETQERVTTASDSSSSNSEESKTNENETVNVLVTPEKARAREPTKNEKETAKKENETPATAAVVITPESKKGTTAPTAVDLLDGLESLPLSEEEERHVENKKDDAPDLVASTSSTESDQFNATNQNCCGATTAFIDSIPLTLPCLVAPSSSITVVNASNASRSRDLIADGNSEEKTPDLDCENDINNNNNSNNNNNEISSIVSEDDDDDDSQWEMVSERSGSTIMISFSGSVLGATQPSMLKNKFVLKELTTTEKEEEDDTNEIVIDHVVLPTDTLQGLCLAYTISATRLRMENGFSGNSLRLAPKKLRIPVMPTANATAINVNDTNNNAKGSSNKLMIRMQDNTSTEFKLYAFVAELPHMELVEAKAYLDLSNWDLDEALRSAREDEGYGGGGGFGGFFVEDPAAVHSADVVAGVGMGATATDNMLLEAVVRPKTLTVRDIYEAMPPYEGNGFELKDIRRSEES